MQIIVCLIDRKQAKYASAHRKADDGDGSIHDAENDQIQARIGLTGCDRRDADDAAEQVHEVMDGIDLEQSEDRIIDESERTDNDEDDAQKPGDVFDEAGHRREKKRVEEGN